MTGWRHLDYRVWKVIPRIWLIYSVGFRKMQNVWWDVGFDCYTLKAVFAKILALDALLGKKTVFSLEIEVKEVWYAGLSWERNGNTGSWPPSPGHKTCIGLKPDVSLSGHHISTSQEQSDKDIFNSYLGQLWSTWFCHVFIIFTSSLSLIVLG